MAKRSYLSQADVPAHSLDEALRIPQSIADNYGKQPTRPLALAEAMELLPGSSRFRMLCGASIAYGLTAGGYNAEVVELTALARRIVAPTEEGDDVAARREAVLRPRVLREFLTRYDGSKLPPEQIACNVLEEMGVPQDRAASTFDLIVDGAAKVGFLREVKGHRYVDLEGAERKSVSNEPSDEATDTPSEESATTEDRRLRKDSLPAARAQAGLKKHNRVFITHGKNKGIVQQLKDLLTFGGFTPVVAIEQESVSKPVPEKVLDEMRRCDAAIIHVGTERKFLDGGGAEHRILNENVLIEIGAAMAFYGRKFILLVERGVSLPSNLQGLYEVRYEGDELGYESTMKLLKAFSDFRS